MEPNGLVTETPEKSINDSHSYILIGAMSILAICAVSVRSVMARVPRIFLLLYILQNGVGCHLFPVRTRKFSY